MFYKLTNVLQKLITPRIKRFLFLSAPFLHNLIQLLDKDTHIFCNENYIAPPPPPPFPLTILTALELPFSYGLQTSQQKSLSRWRARRWAALRQSRNLVKGLPVQENFSILSFTLYLNTFQRNYSWTNFEKLCDRRSFDTRKRLLDIGERLLEIRERFVKKIKKIIGNSRFSESPRGGGLKMCPDIE